MAAPSRPRPAWRAVAIPSEHGGWALSLEAGLLGLLVTPSLPGLALALAAFAAFVARTPLKTALVDRRRHRRLPRTRLAERIAVGELALLLCLGLGVIATAGWAWMVPVALAAPLAGVELWFDMRSRGRRLVPELSGAVGMAATSAAIVVAGGGGARLAVAAWLILSARSVASIPFARVQVDRLHHGARPTTVSDRAQLGAVGLAAVAAVVEPSVVVGVVALVVVATLQLVWVRRPPVPARVLGIRQAAVGLSLIVATALGVHLL
jgi:hypothetical protein